MTEHKRTRQKKQDEVDQKRRLRQQESEPLFEQHHSLEPDVVSITETPFVPRIDEHAELLAMARSDEQRANFMIHLQQTYGNAYAQRLLNSRAAQAKLTINPPSDVYEQEADRVADTVTKTVTSQVRRQVEEEEELQTKPFFQRQAEPEEEEELQTKAALQRQDIPEEQELQTKPVNSIYRQEEEEEELQEKAANYVQHATTNTMPEVVSELEGKINSAKGSGQPLSEDIRDPMERAFVTDFSRVRVHTDSQADSLSQSLQARAFTTGQDIFFKSGEYNPSSSSGQQLLAHELTHTIQQGASTRIARWLGKGHEVITQHALGLVGNTYSKKAKEFLADRAGQMDADPDTYLKMRVGMKITDEKISYYRGRKRKCRQNHLTLKKLIEKRNKLQEKYDKLEQKSGFLAKIKRNRIPPKLTKLKENIRQLVEEQKAILAELKQKWEDNWLHTRYSTHHPEHGEAGAYQEGGKANENAAKVNEKIVQALVRFNSGLHWEGLQILADALHGAEDRGAHGEGEPYSGHDTRLKFADEELIFKWEQIAKEKPRKDEAHGGDWTDNVDTNFGEVPKSLSLANFVLKQFQENLSPQKQKRLRNLGKWWRFWEREKGKPSKRKPREPLWGKKKWSEYAAEAELPKEPHKEFTAVSIWPWLATLAEQVQYPHPYWKDFEVQNQEFMEWHLNRLLKKFEKDVRPSR